MKIKQIGNGSGLNVNETNSSFLIEANDELLLIDCGFNVPQKLFEMHKNNEIDITKLKNVFITHGHSDHFGGLETLIFKMYFEYNIVLHIGLPSTECLAQIRLLNKIYESSSIKSRKLTHSFMYANNETLKNLSITSFENNHKVIESYGFIIKDNNLKSIAISGDTKAFCEFEELSKDCDLIYHDFSKWDCPSRNVHACKSDIEAEYTKEFINRLKFYHNDETFDTKWINV